MTWIKTVSESEGGEALSRALNAQKELYPIEYANPVFPTTDGAAGLRGCAFRQPAAGGC